MWRRFDSFSAPPAPVQVVKLRFYSQAWVCGGEGAGCVLVPQLPVLSGSGVCGLLRTS